MKCIFRWSDFLECCTCPPSTTGALSEWFSITFHSETSQQKRTLNWYLNWVMLTNQICLKVWISIIFISLHIY